jgi:diguanylate cyclase (GGDEF)-like protein
MWKRGAFTRLASLLSATRFRDRGLSDYAEGFMVAEVRRGVMSMAGLSLLLHLLAALLYIKLGQGWAYLYTYGMMVTLSLHVYLSARQARALRELYALGITLLVVNSAALVLLAHKTGSVSGPMLASIVLLFMVMPLVPWGLAQSLSAILLVYGVFTFSTYGVAERFTPESLWTLQFLLLASALATSAIVARNVYVRREDLKVRFRLERAHTKLQLVSHQDPLTNAWNRRFLEANFSRIVEGYRLRKSDVHFAVLDIDNFKGINDQYGHHYGDSVLSRLVDVFREQLAGNGYIIRLGGDEFAVLYCGDDVDRVIGPCIAALGTVAEGVEGQPTAPVSASVGVVRVGPGSGMSLDVVYRRADQALYAEKRRRGRRGEPRDQWAAFSEPAGEQA